MSKIKELEADVGAAYATYVGACVAYADRTARDAAYAAIWDAYDTYQKELENDKD